MRRFKRVACLLLVLILCVTAAPMTWAQGEYTKVVLSMSSNLTDQRELWGYYQDNILYVSVEDLCAVTGYHLLEEQQERIILGSASTKELSVRELDILPMSDEMMDATFTYSPTIEMPAIQIDGESYISLFHMANYLGMGYSLLVNGNPQVTLVKRYDIYDAMTQVLESDCGYYFSWDEMEFQEGSAEDNLTLAGIAALLAQESSIPRLIFDADGIYQEDLENDLLKIVTNEGVQWLENSPSTSELYGLLNDTYSVGFDWFGLFQDLYVPEDGGTLGTVLESVGNAGDLITTGGDSLESLLQAFDTMNQYSNLTDTQKTLLQNTLVNHGEDSQMVTEDDFWKMLSDAAKNVDGRVQSQITAENDASLKAVTDIAYQVAGAVSGASDLVTDKNPVFLVWDCMTWTLDLLPEVEQATLLHDAYNCSMVQQAANDLLVAAYNDLYYNNFYYGNSTSQRPALEYLKSALVLQLKSTLTTRESLLASDTIADTATRDRLAGQCTDTAELLNRVEGCMLNAPMMFDAQYDDDLSWMAQCTPEPWQIYDHAVNLLDGASFDVTKEGTMKAGFAGFQDVNFTQEMHLSGYGSGRMSANGSYSQTGGSQSGETAYQFTYREPNFTKHYTAPTTSTYTQQGTLLNLTAPFVAHQTSSSVQDQGDGTSVYLLTYDGTQMNQYTCGLLDNVLPDGFRIYWSPNEAYADQDGVVSATLQAVIDENYNLRSLQVTYVLNGGVQDFTQLEGTTTFTFRNIARPSILEGTQVLDLTGSWLQTGGNDPMFLTLREDGSMKYYAALNGPAEYTSTYVQEGNVLSLDLLAPDGSAVTTVPYQVANVGDGVEQITLTADGGNAIGDLSLLAGMEGILEGTYQRLSFTQIQLQNLCTDLRVPANARVTVQQGEPSYWSAGECWLIQVSVYEGEEFVAGASFDPQTMEMVRNIFLYSK